MLQGANNDIFNPLAPTAHNSVKMYYFHWKFIQLKSVTARLRIIFCTQGTNGLTAGRENLDKKPMTSQGLR